MNYPQNKLQRTAERIRACNYLTVTQIFLKDNFLLERPLSFDDIKPRLLGHWGTCPGINLVYSCMRNIFADQKENTVFVLGPGHGFPALQANLFYDGDLAAVDSTLSRDYAGLAKISELFSRIGGFPSHASPSAPGVICEGGELGYSLATAYGYCLGHPERTAIVLLGDGEFETATTLASLNLNDLLSSPNNGKIIPILHLNGYKISGPTVASRRSAHQLNELIRGFGFQPIRIEERLSPVDTEELDIVDSFDDDEEDSDSSSFEAVEHKITDFIREEYDDQDQDTARTAFELTYQDTDLIIQNLITDLDAALLQAKQSQKPVFIILETEKGLTGPLIAEDLKVRGNFKAHQVPLPKAKSDETELRALESWLRSYHFEELFNREKGFIHE
jgi:phosphoketolase